ncbi:MAG: hypothetical protein Q4P25_02605 [Tissierellia bacterium]|nr:hypothetical protein [Tissierellia bacterium]
MKKVITTLLFLFLTISTACTRFPTALVQDLPLDGYQLEAHGSLSIEDSRNENGKAAVFKYNLMGEASQGKVHYELESVDKDIPSEKENPFFTPVKNLSYYYSDGKNYYNLSSLRELADDRASQSLRKIHEDYVSVPKEVAYGFELRHPLDLYWVDLPKLFQDETFLQALDKLSTASLVTASTIKVTEEEISIETDGEQFFEDLATYLSSLEKDRETYKKEIAYIGKEVFHLKEEEIQDFFAMVSQEEFPAMMKDFGDMVKNSTLKFHGIKKDSAFHFDVDLFLSSQWEGEKDLSTPKYHLKATGILKPSQKNILIPTHVKELTDLQYSELFLPTIADNLMIQKGDKNLHFETFPILFEDHYYVDSTIIDQIANRNEDGSYRNNGKTVQLGEDHFYLGEEKFDTLPNAKNDSKYPLRQIAQYLGYKVNFIMDREFDSYYIELE